MVKPTFYACGGCGMYHRAGFAGDCRDDNNRFGLDEIEELYGSRGWEQDDDTDPCKGFDA